jgi:hypothetical protein
VRPDLVSSPQLTLSRRSIHYLLQGPLPASCRFRDTLITYEGVGAFCECSYQPTATEKRLRACPGMDERLVTNPWSRYQLFGFGKMARRAGKGSHKTWRACWILCRCPQLLEKRKRLMSLSNIDCDYRHLQIFFVLLTLGTQI